MATATEMDLLPVRQTLIDKYGVANERIGYNPQTGYVTIDGRDILKPPVNREGTTFAGQDVFNSAQGAINQANQIYNLQQRALNPQQNVNPIDQRFNEILNTLQGRITNPTPINVNDVYASPQYRAQQRQAERQAQQATRTTQEAFGGSGFARSTPALEAVNRIQNQANEFLETQVVPQIMQQLQAERDRQTADLLGFLGVLGQQQGLYDTRQQNQFRNAFDVLDFLTAQQNRAEDVAFRNRQAELAQQNLEAEKAYRAQRDSEEDKRWWADFYRRGEEFAQQMGYNWAQLNQREKERLADEAYRNAQLNLQLQELNSRQNSQRNAAFENERQGLVNALRSGQLTPAQALQQIDQDVQLQFYTPEEAQQLRQIVQTLAPTVTQTKELTKEQQAQIPSNKEIDKIWETEGKPQGIPLLDFRAWYKDPNGRLAGISFETWQQLYGPQLGPG